MGTANALYLLRRLISSQNQNKIQKITYFVQAYHQRTSCIHSQLRVRMSSLLLLLLLLLIIIIVVVVVVVVIVIVIVSVSVSVIVIVIVIVVEILLPGKS